MKHKQKTQGLERELQTLLDELCVELGICLPPLDKKRIESADFYAAQDFAADVFEAEKMKPEDHQSLFRQIKRRFTDRFGNSVSAREYEVEESSVESEVEK